MGEHAEALINGDDDYITGEYLGEGSGFPRTNTRLDKEWKKTELFQLKDGRVINIDHDPKYFAKGTKAIRKELAKLIDKKIKEIGNATKKQRNIIVQESRREINKKYGHCWRNQYARS